MTRTTKKLKVAISALLKLLILTVVLTFVSNALAEETVVENKTVNHKEGYRGYIDIENKADTIKNQIKDDVWVVYYYNSEKEVERRFKPIWDAVAREWGQLDESKGDYRIKFAHVDCKGNATGCVQQNIRRYPTVLVTVRGQEIKRMETDMLLGQFYAFVEEVGDIHNDVFATSQILEVKNIKEKLKRGFWIVRFYKQHRKTGLGKVQQSPDDDSKKDWERVTKSVYDEMKELRVKVGQINCAKISLHSDTFRRKKSPKIELQQKGEASKSEGKKMNDGYEHGDSDDEYDGNGDEYENEPVEEEICREYRVGKYPAILVIDSGKVLESNKRANQYSQMLRYIQSVPGRYQKQIEEATKINKVEYEVKGINERGQIQTYHENTNRGLWVIQYYKEHDFSSLNIHSQYEYNLFAKAMKNKVQVGQVNCSKNQHLCFFEKDVTNSTIKYPKVVINDNGNITDYGTSLSTVASLMDAVGPYLYENVIKPIDTTSFALRNPSDLALRQKILKQNDDGDDDPLLEELNNKDANFVDAKLTIIYFESSYFDSTTDLLNIEFLANVTISLGIQSSFFYSSDYHLASHLVGASAGYYTASRPQLLIMRDAQIFVYSDSLRDLAAGDNANRVATWLAKEHYSLVVDLSKSYFPSSHYITDKDYFVVLVADSNSALTYQISSRHFSMVASHFRDVSDKRYLSSQSTDDSIHPAFRFGVIKHDKFESYFKAKLSFTFGPPYIVVFSHLIPLDQNMLSFVYPFTGRHSQIMYESISYNKFELIEFLSSDLFSNPKVKFNEILTDPKYIAHFVENSSPMLISQSALSTTSDHYLLLKYHEFLLVTFVMLCIYFFYFFDFSRLFSKR